jgi:hypothetical protein
MPSEDANDPNVANPLVFPVHDPSASAWGQVRRDGAHLCEDLADGLPRLASEVSKGSSHAVMLLLE